MYVLGCLDYVAFCGSLQDGYIANILSIANDPPSALNCLETYCIVASDISAPVLVSFPSKQMISVSTISFSIRNLFVVSASQIICFGFKSSEPAYVYRECTSEEQNCAIFPRSISYGDPVSTISMNYTREYFGFLSSTAKVADWTVRVSDCARLDACSNQLSADLNARSVDCGALPNAN